MHDLCQTASSVATQILFVDSRPAVSAADAGMHVACRNACRGHCGDDMQTPCISRDDVAIGVGGPCRKVFKDGSLVSNLVYAEDPNYSEKTNDVAAAVDPDGAFGAALTDPGVPGKPCCNS